MYYTIDASARPRSIDALERFAGLFMAPPRSLALYACSVNRASDLPSECGGPSVGVFVLIVGFERRKNTHRALCVVHHLTNKKTDLQIFHHSLIVLHSSRFSNFPSTAVTAAKRHRRGSSEFIDWFFVRYRVGVLLLRIAHTVCSKNVFLRLICDVFLCSLSGCCFPFFAYDGYK